MGSHPVNLALRFFLELSAMVTIGVWGWRQSDNWIRFVLSVGLPIIIAAIWGTFAVPNDPSRSRFAPVAVPGIVRLVIELAIFTLATWALYDMEFIRLSWIIVTTVAVHYIVSYDRIMWLIKQ